MNSYGLLFPPGEITLGWSLMELVIVVLTHFCFVIKYCMHSPGGGDRINNDVMNGKLLIKASQCC